LAIFQQLADSMSNALDYLVIAAHPDDAEIGTGGTILSLKAAGARVGVLDLTSGEPTPFGTPELRRQETEAATAILGLDYRHNLGLPNRALVADLDARRQVAEVIRELRPRVLLSHYWEDAHPDHVAASALVDAARFWAKLTKTDMRGTPHYPERIVYYFAAHLRQHIQPSFVLDVSEHHEKKMEALACYHSQFVDGRPATPSFFGELRDVDRYWGWTIRARYGEPFRCRENVGLRRLQDLV
jgi:N-acetylglucosamine malate deacetylase 1